MKPFLSFIGGCEFTYLIQQLRSAPDDYFQFDVFFSYEQTQSTNAYDFVLKYQRVFSRVIVRFTKGKKNAGMQTILTDNYFTESQINDESVVYSFDDLQGRQIKPLPEWFSPMESSDEKEVALST